jgi:LPS-assembly protein
VIRLVLILLFISITAFAGENVIIEADSVETPEESVYHASGGVTVFHGEKTLIADEITYNKNINMLYANGNVSLTENGSILNCTSLEYNTEDETGKFFDADAFMPPFHWFKAGELNRLSKVKYSLRDVAFSTCDGDNPDWSFNATSANVTVGGYLSSWNTTARIKNFPVFYTPYIVYPVKSERETGLLVPKIGYSSTDGAFIQPKFFWNIDVDQDATFATVISENSPAHHSLEHRYRPNASSYLYTYAEYSLDKKRYPENRNGQYSIANDTGRYLLYNRSNIKLGSQLYIKTQIDTVSDYEYFDDFNKYSIFNYTNNTDTYYTNLTFGYSAEYADVDVKYMDTMEYNVGSAYIKEHIYSAPKIAIQKHITELPVNIRYYFAYDNVRYNRYFYDYFANTHDSKDISYEREHLSVNTYKPFDLYVGVFTPSLTLYKTRWHGIKNPDNQITDIDVSSFAEINADGDTAVRNTYTQFHTFQLNEIYRRYSGFKHSIYNTLSYKQTPNLEQPALPHYIYEDEIQWEKEYSYAITNYLDAPSWNMTLTNTQKYEMTRKDRRFETFMSELSLFTSPFQMHIRHDYNRYEKDADFLSTGFTFNRNKFSISTSYTFDKDDYEIEDNNTTFSIGTSYSASKYDISYTRSISGTNSKLSMSNLNDTRDSLSATYKSDCWSFGVSYVRDTDYDSIDINKKDEVEHTVMFIITLRGLGEYSTSPL